MLLGLGRQYLLASGAYRNDLRLFALAGFKRVVQEAETYARAAGLDLQDWLAKSFGIWREAPQDVT